MASAAAMRAADSGSGEWTPNSYLLIRVDATPSSMPAAIPNSRCDRPNSRRRSFILTANKFFAPAAIPTNVVGMCYAGHYECRSPLWAGSVVQSRTSRHPLLSPIMEKATDEYAQEELHFLFTLRSELPGKSGSLRPVAEVATAVQIEKIVETGVQGAWLARREADRWKTSALHEIRSYEQVASGGTAVYVLSAEDGYQALFASNRADPIPMCCVQITSYDTGAGQ